MGTTFLNGSVIPLLCKLSGVSQTDVVGKILKNEFGARKLRNTSGYYTILKMSAKTFCVNGGVQLGLVHSTNLPVPLRVDESYHQRQSETTNPAVEER